jgi:antitoxin PrlF
VETSTLTSKYQATVPAGVRKALGLRAGDTVAWQVENGVATVRAVPRGLKGWEPLTWQAFAAEWLSDEDEEAFRDL